MQASKSSLRRQIRHQRQALSPAQQHHAARALYRQLNKSGLLLRHKRIALYLASDGEISPDYFLPLLWRRKKACFVPVLDTIDKSRMRFQRLRAGDSFVRNRFNILEPRFQARGTSPARFLSLVLMPLVTFDAKGNRMGMGGGFYDRAFAFKQKERLSRPPKLVGLAHEFQRQNTLDNNDWDIPMASIVTDRAVYVCESH